mgnify:FL=1
MRKIVATKNRTDVEPVNTIVRHAEEGRSKIDVGGLKGASRSLLAAQLFKKLERPLLIVCPAEKETAAFARELSLFLGGESVFHYPSLDFLTIDMFALQKEDELSRLEALANLQVGNKTVVVVSAAALMQKVMPVDEFGRHFQIISVGDTLNIDEFGAGLVAQGYRRKSLVDEKGEFSFRGNIIDIFPPAEKNPLRLEMFGDEIETIRVFDPSSQRSIGTATAFIVPPSGEVIINSSTLELAVRNIRRRSDELSLPREIRNRLVDTLKEGLMDSVNPVFLPLFYESYDSEEGL